MGRSLRGCFAGRLVEVTSKTFQSRYLLRPSREVVATLKGVIARAQANTEMKIVAVVGMSNHVHFLLLPTSTLQLALFMHYFMSNSARKIGRLHGWEGRLWKKRYKLLIVTYEEEAQVARLKYLLSHGAKEGLVRSPSEWPGLQVVSELCSGATQVHGGEWHDGSAEYRAKLNGYVPKKGDFTEKGLSFELSPLPCWEPMTVQERRAAIQRLVDEATADAREARAGAPVFGVRSVLRQHPRSAPSKPKRSYAPACHAASRSARLELIGQLRAFAEAFLYASTRIREGLTADFPEGCFPPRLPYLPEQTPG